MKKFFLSIAVIFAVALIALSILTAVGIVDPSAIISNKEKLNTEVSDSHDNTAYGDQNTPPGPSLYDREQKEAPEVIEEIPEEPETEYVSLLFAGDLYINEVLQSKYRSSGISAAATQELLDRINASDFFIVNQEFPFGTSGEAMEEKEFTFRVPPSFVSVEQDLGVDLVTIANNHMLDFGRGPLSETFETLESAGIPYIGGGRNMSEAASVKILEKDGFKVGFLGATRVVPDGGWGASSNGSGLLMTYDPERLIKAIRESKDQCDYLVVYVHWGIERNQTPEDYQTELAKQLIDAGADAVIGSHPHVLQGIEIYKDKPIFYSLGNFIFRNSDYNTMMAEIKINPEDKTDYEITLVPCTSISNQMGLSDRLNFIPDMLELSMNIEISQDLKVTEAQ